MNFIELVRAYMSVNLALSVAALALACAVAVNRRFGWMRSRDELRLHYILFPIAVAAGLGASLVPRSHFFEPVAKVWSAPSITAFDRDVDRGVDRDAGGGVLTLEKTAEVAADRAALAAALTVLLIATAGLTFLVFNIWRLARARRRFFLIRRIGAVAVFAAEEVPGAFSFWLPGLSAVVLPSESLSRDPRGSRLALKHELQHHRQGDTRWIFAFQFLTALCFANPLIHFWNRWLCEIQEFACDEALVDRDVDSLAYARLLVESAETALARKSFPACATGLTILGGRKQLHRRIKKMLSSSSSRKQKPRRGFFVAAAVILTALIASATYASSGFVHDRRVSVEQAEAMASRARAGSNFPIVVNDLVVRELNRFLGTPEGRESLRQGLARMPQYREVIDRKLAAYGAPSELLAVPLVESNYRNRPQDPTHKSWGAGLWMFIESTARNFGLRVDSTVDERLDVEAETDAAMRYLTGLNLRFNHWHLALLSYNVGEQRVQKAIDTVGSRDAWALVRSGIENDRAYLARVMAAILIVKNPEVLQ